MYGVTFQGFQGNIDFMFFTDIQSMYPGTTGVFLLITHFYTG